MREAVLLEINQTCQSKPMTRGGGHGLFVVLAKRILQCPSLPVALSHEERPWPCRDCPYLQSLGRLQTVCVSGPCRRNSSESMSVRQEITKTATADGGYCSSQPCAGSFRNVQKMANYDVRVMGKKLGSRECGMVSDNKTLEFGLEDNDAALHSLSPADWPCLVALSTCRGWLLPSNDSILFRSARGVWGCGAPSALNASEFLTRFSPELIQSLSI